MAENKIDGFWTGPIWRAVETFACGMAGVPVPSTYAKGASEGAPAITGLADNCRLHDNLPSYMPKQTGEMLPEKSSEVNKRYGRLPVGDACYRDADEAEGGETPEKGT